MIAPSKISEVCPICSKHSHKETTFTYADETRRIGKRISKHLYECSICSAKVWKYRLEI